VASTRIAPLGSRAGPNRPRTSSTMTGRCPAAAVPIAPTLAVTRPAPDRRALAGLPAIRRLAGLPAIRRLAGLPAIRRLAGLPAIRRLAGLPAYFAGVAGLPAHPPAYPPGGGPARWQGPPAHPLTYPPTFRLIAELPAYPSACLPGARPGPHPRDARAARKSPGAGEVRP